MLVAKPFQNLFIPHTIQTKSASFSSFLFLSSQHCCPSTHNFHYPYLSSLYLSIFSFTSMAEVTKRYAVVTGANKGIGFEVCRQLASNGITVVLTARDEKRGLEAVEKLKKSGFDHVVFHQLDVTDPASISSLADFIRTQFGKLDVLVNNAGVGGLVLSDAHADTLAAFVKEGAPIKWHEIMVESYELAEECIKINYYGPKRMCEALIPLLQLSDSPRIVNVSASMGQLQNITNESAKEVLRNVEKLTEDRVDELVSEYLDDYKKGLLGTKTWPAFMSAYIVSKAALNANARILAKKYPSFCINCVCPGFVKTDINYNSGKLTAEEGAESAVSLALLPNGSPSGLFYRGKEVSSF